MKTSKKLLSAILCLALLIGWFPGKTANAAAPTITGWDSLGNYMERETALVAPGVQITGGGSYDDSYVKFGVLNSSTDETLALVQSEFPSIEAGVVTSVGTAVYLGDGVSTKQIGTINKISDGQQGRNLQIDFSTPLVNGNFEDNGGSDTGWTINRAPVIMGPLASKTQGRPVTISGSGPYTVTGPGYSFTTDVNYISTQHPAWGYEGDERPLSVTAATYSNVYRSQIVTEGENHALRLFFSGTLSVNNNGKPSYGTTFGPEAISTPFYALAGDTLAFDWKASLIDDDYEVYGFLYNLETNNYTELMYGRGGNQPWTTAPGVIPANGTYQFRFVTGSYDRTGGLAVGASLYIDNVRVFGNYVDDAVVEKVARLVTYHNSSNNPPDNRTITIEARNKAGDISSDSSNFTVTQKNVLTYLPSANGTLVGTLVQDLETSETGTPVTAVPDAGFRFIGWSDGKQTATRTDDASADLTVTALFAASEAAIGTVDTRYNVDNDRTTISSDESVIKLGVTVESFLKNLTKNEHSDWKVIPSGTNVTNETQFNTVTGKAPAEYLRPGDKLAVKSADGSIVVYEIEWAPSFAGGTGTAGDPYRIDTAEQLADMKYELDKHFVLTGDIDLSDYSNGDGWKPIGDQTSPFKGTFNGDGFVIRNMTIDRPGADDVGLFGHTDRAVIRNVGLENAEVNGGDYTGILVGRADNTTIENSYALGDVSGGDYTGGLAGQVNGSVVSKTFVSGSVEGTGNTGGLIGQANGGKVNHSYYNSDTTSQSDNSGKGSPRTTSELQTQATFENWDFNTIWVINEGNDYPKLMPRVVQTVTAPTGAVIAGGTISAQVSSGTSSVTVDLAVNPSASWKLYSDEACTQEITDRTLALTTGTATAYVKVTAKDGMTTSVYKLTVTTSSSSGGGGAPATEIIRVPVEGKGSNAVTSVTINRTKANDGTKRDEVTLTLENAKEAVAKLKEAGSDTARIVLPDTKDEVSQTDIRISKDALKAFADGGINLEIVTVNGRISIPAASLQGVGDDLYFRVVPIKEQSKRKEVEQRARTEEAVRRVAGSNEVEIVGRPMTIETNLSSRAVDITLPIPAAELPSDSVKLQRFLDNLSVFIEHDDGEKELVKGKIVTLEDGSKGITFRITKFSTFTIVQLGNVSENTQTSEMHKGYIAGFADGTFKPDQGISRAEMAALLARVGPGADQPSQAIKYTDVSGTYWARSVIQHAQSTGLMTGFNNGSFGPDKTITRGEMAAITARWLKLEGKAESGYSDAQGHWAAGYISLVGKAGIMQGMPDGKFQPDKTLTRAEAVATINRILKREPLKNSAKPSWKDVSSSHWAFGHIEEASHDHEASLHSK
ncbi:S-layer homology domain-containing protein [Cohnella terricola]|nr:S-layer homology domain-containing protein [Cohnella terricola]